MKTLIFILFTLYSCSNNGIECFSSINDIENCSHSFVRHRGVSSKEILNQIYGEYQLIDTLEDHSFVINKSGRYYHLIGNVIVSGGELDIFISDFNMVFYPSFPEYLLSKEMLYCDDVLINKDTNLKMCLICKCEL